MNFSLQAATPLAIGLAAVVGFLVGGVWYGALFGKLWPRLHGYDTPEKTAAMAKNAGQAFGVMFVGEIFMAFGLAILIGTFGIKGAVNGAILGLVISLTIGLAEIIMQNAAHRKSPAAFAIDAGHQILYLTAAGAVIGYFAK